MLNIEAGDTRSGSEKVLIRSTVWRAQPRCKPKQPQAAPCAHICGSCEEGPLRPMHGLSGSTLCILFDRLRDDVSCVLEIHVRFLVVFVRATRATRPERAVSAC